MTWKHSCMERDEKTSRFRRRPSHKFLGRFEKVLRGVRFLWRGKMTGGMGMDDNFEEAQEEVLRLHAAWEEARREWSQALAAKNTEEYPQTFQTERDLFQKLELARIIFVKRWIDFSLRHWMDRGVSNADWWAPLPKEDVQARLEVLVRDDYEDNDEFCFLEDRAILGFRIEKDEHAPKDVCQLVWIVCGKKCRQYSTIAKGLHKHLRSQPDPLGQMVEIMARKDQISRTPTAAWE